MPLTFRGFRPILAFRFGMVTCQNLPGHALTFLTTWDPPVKASSPRCGDFGDSGVLPFSHQFFLVLVPSVVVDPNRCVGMLTVWSPGML